MGEVILGDLCFVTAPNYYLDPNDGDVGEVMEINNKNEYILMDFKISKSIVVYYTEITKILTRQENPEYFI